MAGQPAFEHLQHLAGGAFAHAPHAFAGDARQMRGKQHVRQPARSSDAAGSGWTVKTSSAAPPRWPGAQRLDERGLVDDGAARHVHQPRAGLHASQALRAEQAAGRFIQRTREHHVIRLRQGIVEGDIADDFAVGCGVRRTPSTRMPKPRAQMRASAWPIAPIPTIASVFPCSSIAHGPPVAARRAQDGPRSVASMRGRYRARASIWPTAYSATLCALTAAHSPPRRHARWRPARESCRVRRRGVPRPSGAARGRRVRRQCRAHDDEAGVLRFPREGGSVGLRWRAGPRVVAKG